MSIFCGILFGQTKTWPISMFTDEGALLLPGASDEEVSATDVTAIGFPEGTKVTNSGLKYGGLPIARPDPESGHQFIVSFVVENWPC